MGKGTLQVAYEKLVMDNIELQAENKLLKNCISITLSEIENRFAGIDFEMIERRFEQVLKEK